MKKDNEQNGPSDIAVDQPRRVRLPGFLIDEDVGLGDVIKRATSYIGVKTCGGCQRRAARLNRWMTFTKLNARRPSA